MWWCQKGTQECLSWFYAQWNFRHLIISGEDSIFPEQEVHWDSRSLPQETFLQIWLGETREEGTMNSVSLESHSSCPSWSPWTLTRSPIAPRSLGSTVPYVLVVKHRERAFSFMYSLVYCSPNIHLAVSLHSWHLVRLTLGSRIPREQQVFN